MEDKYLLKKKKKKEERNKWRTKWLNEVQSSCLVMSDPSRSLELQQAKLPSPSPIPRACLNAYPLSQ